MAYRFAARSTTPGYYVFVFGTFGQLIDLGDIEEGVDRGDGDVGTFSVPDEDEVKTGVGYGKDGTEFTGALIGGTTISLVPTASTVSTGEVSGQDLVGYQHAAQAFTFTVVDSEGDVIDLDGKTVSFRAHDPALPTTAIVSRTGAVSGDNNNVVTVSLTNTDTATAKRYAYRLWNVTDKQILAAGVWHVNENPASA